MNTYAPALLSACALAAIPPSALAGTTDEGASDAGAGPAGATSPGHQANPPGPPTPRPPPLQPDPRARRTVRGCPLDLDCRAMEGMRAFELQAFPRPGARSPWIDGDDADGHTQARLARRRAGRTASDPTELRPDLPWLANLELPDVPIQWHDRLITYLEYFKDDRTGRRIMSSWLRGRGRYIGMMRRELRKEGLPRDLVYVSMIESAFNPHGYSRAGASGLWQFMPSSGRVYGLKQTSWIDERNDPVLSTRAAVLFLKDLHHRFGDWHLALAAYNAGYGAILHAVTKYNTNDFWQLLAYENALPWESSVYVPKILAAAIVAHNLELFGYGDVEPEPAIKWDLVEVPKSIELRAVARAAGTDVDEIKLLNPQLRRNRTPPTIDSYPIRIPKGRAKLFAERFPQVDGDWDEFDAYVASHGERFEDIATTHGISYRRLLSLNGLTSEAEVQGGTILVVPKVSEDEKRANRAEADDNLHASGEPRGKPGDNYIVAVPDASFDIEGKTRVFYRVVSGDTLFEIAQSFGVNYHTLAEWNGLDAEANLQPRMVLQVWVDPSFDPAENGIQTLDPDRVDVVERGSDGHLDAAEARMGRARVRYVAKERRTLHEIGRRYGLTHRDLARINRIPQNTVLEPGDEIIIYEVVDRNVSRRAEQQWRRARRAGRRNR